MTRRQDGTCEVRTGGESPPGVDSGVILVGDFSFAYDIKMMLDCVQIVKTGKEEEGNFVSWYCVCVCVFILRPAEHVLKARVLETPLEYRTLGGKPLDI
jgi:hypothetical protein